MDVETNVRSGAGAAEPAGTARPPATPTAVDPRRWLALSVLLLVACMDLLDVSIVNVAIPAIQDGIGASYPEIEWIVAGYTLAFAVGLITGGRLGDIYGRKRVFLTGVVVFTAASALCGIAQDPAMLIGSRVLQGAGAAIMVPQVLSIIQVTFPAKERSAALGTYGAAVGLATISGPLLGGLLLRADLFSWGWRPIFLVNVIIGALAIPAAIACIRESCADSAPRLDIGGVVLVTGSLFLLVYPLVQGRDLGWPPWTYAMMACSLPVFIAFLRYERRVTSPLVVPSLFRRRTFVAGSAVTLAFMVGLASFYLILTLYLQIGLGFSALHAGLTTVPSSIGLGISAGIATRLAPLLGRRLLVPGAVVAAVSMVWMIFTIRHYGVSITSWEIAPSMFTFGVGMGIVAPSLIDAALSDVPHEEAGAASGLVNTVLQLGGAIGIALIGVLFFNLLGSRADRSSAAVVPELRAAMTAQGIPSARQDPLVAEFRRCFHEQASAADVTSVPASCRATSAVVARAGHGAAARDFGSAISGSLWFQVGTFGLTALLIMFLPDRIRKVE